MSVASQQYMSEVMRFFQDEKFMNAPEAGKKQLVGSFIYPFVTQMVGIETSPKVTGMIIDLPLADLNYSVSNLETLQSKVFSAVKLLIDTQYLKQETFATMPIA